LLFPLEHFWQHSGKRQFETIGLKELAVAEDVGRCADVDSRDGITGTTGENNWG
jgi:hypothetical protein